MIVERIELEQRVIQVHILIPGIMELLDPNCEEQVPAAEVPKDRYILSSPVQLKRCGIETKLVTSNGPIATSHPESIIAMQKALRKALKWNQALLDGKASTLTALAEKENVAQRYICDLIKLAYLAPDIIEAVIEGKTSSGLTLDRLKKGLSIDWNKQRKLLEFPT